MKVEFLKPGAGFGLGYHPGEVAELDDSHAKKIIELGVAIPAKEKKAETAESKAPKEKKAEK
ncbi:MAG: hypothetical protein WAZ98_03920 [Cyclobacteriaceae bacterium]